MEREGVSKRPQATKNPDAFRSGKPWYNKRFVGSHGSRGGDLLKRKAPCELAVDLFDLFGLGVV